MKPVRGLFILDDDAFSLTYGPDELRDIARHVTMVAPPQTRQSIAARPALLTDVDAIFSGWGAPRLDDAFLRAAPRLKVMFYAAGSLSRVLTDAGWARPVAVTSALSATAVPVAEYPLSVILFSLKHGWRLSRQARDRRTFRAADRDAAPGGY